MVTRIVFHTYWDREKKIEILRDLSIFNAPEYEKTIFEMRYVCLHVCVYTSPANEQLGGFYLVF
jgi:hypothetical protein